MNLLLISANEVSSGKAAIATCAKMANYDFLQDFANRDLSINTEGALVQLSLLLFHSFL